jgi:hypothetical protein
MVEIPPRMPLTLERRHPQNRAHSQIWERNQREKNHEGFMHTSATKSQRERSQNHHKKIGKKGLQKSPQRGNGRHTIKPWGTTPNHLFIPWRFIQGLACLPIIHPSLKISPWSSRDSPRNSKGTREEENSKTKWARVPRDGCHPLTTWVIWRQLKDETTPKA